jgi:maleamate amidohydrolase
VEPGNRNFRTIVVKDGVGVRALGPHDANLFDMEQKYADLHATEEVIAHLGGVRVAAAE